MKRSSLLPLVALVFAVAYACTDSMAPARFLTPKDPALVVEGDPPPPPVDVAVIMEFHSHTFVSGPFNGVYFAKATSIESAVAAAEVGDESLTFDGTAWLRLDNKQPDLGTTASANARFKITNDKLSGHGTLVIDGHVIVITEVTGFEPNPNCGITGERCAFITFNATVDGLAGHTGTAQAFDRETCTLITPVEGDPYYDCPGAGS